MRQCDVCGGKLETTRRDVEREIDGQHVRVANMQVAVCTGCGHVELKWWTSWDQLDRMLRARLQREQFEAITWEDLITGETITVMI